MYSAHFYKVVYAVILVVFYSAYGEICFFSFLQRWEQTLINTCPSDYNNVVLDRGQHGKKHAVQVSEHTTEPQLSAYTYQC